MAKYRGGWDQSKTSLGGKFVSGEGQSGKPFAVLIGGSGCHVLPAEKY